MKKFYFSILILALFGGVFLSGFWYSQRLAASENGAAGRRVLYYVDPMNPSHTSDKPGLAPCGMKLEPVYADEEANGQTSGANSLSMTPGAVRISPEKQQIIGVQVRQVEAASESHVLRTLGRVAADENRVYRVLAPTDGYMPDIQGAVPTGSMVQKEQLLASYYSVDSLGAQQAYLLALNTADRRQNDQSAGEHLSMLGSQLRQAEEKLKIFGMGETQIREIARTRQVATSIELRAQTPGIVVSRNIFPYSRFEKDAEFFRIVDLSRVWVLADVFENEEKYIKPGTATRISLPGRDMVLHGKVSDALAQFDSDSRTYKVRIDVDNPEMILRPDAFVDIEFLVEFPPAITVPVEAVLDSGLKKTVFIDLGNGFFEPRKVKTGWRFGERVEITGGLMSGEKIVTSANFLIDSESRMKLAAAGVKESVAVIDPVCGMDVNESKAKTAGMKSEYNGASYYFCNDECKHIFDKVPERFVKAVAQSEPLQQEHAIRQEQTVMQAKPVEHSSHMAPKLVSSGAVLNDPVCGMKLDEGEAEASGVKSEHTGTTYYFCSNACKQRFDKNPERFTQKEAVEQISHHSASTFKPEHTDMMGHADMMGEGQ